MIIYHEVHMLQLSILG